MDNRTKLYQFRPDSQVPTNRDLEALRTKKIWLSKIHQLNDPFEFASCPDLIHGVKKADIGVTCFSRSITNPLLWSHYANSHNGFAIGYEIPKEKWQDGLLSVVYEDIRPTADFSEVTAATTKPTCWAYEQEVRLICQTGNTLRDFNFATEIYFGARMTIERAEAIASALKDTHPDIKKFRMHTPEQGFFVYPKAEQ